MKDSSATCSLNILASPSTELIYGAFQNYGADLKKIISNKPYKIETHSAHHWIEEGSKFRSPLKSTS
jgi:16S rRNA A1518/A1519 N6-dimethyltransferase RsmA/KsgA/DIM1 with predicted DNA glycosylase/AP lyase activity